MANVERGVKGQIVDTNSTINQDVAIEYWSQITADNTGVLGGYPQVSRVDLQGSSNFFGKVRRKSSIYPVSQKLDRVADCGAGIGRITKGFLFKVARTVDIVEPVVKLTDIITKSEDFEGLRLKGSIGEVYNVGLQDWSPSIQYDMVWNQWCLGQLPDTQLRLYFQRIKQYIKKGGWIIVKENMSSDPDGLDIFDENDNSVTRSDGKFRQIFDEVNLKIIATELQTGFPKGLFRVRMYALQPKF